MEDNHSHPVIKQGWLRVIILLVPYMLIAGMFQMLGMLIMGWVTGDDLIELLGQQENNRGDLRQLLIIQMFTLAGALLVIWIFCRHIDRRSLYSLGLDLKGRGKDIVLGVAAGAIIMTIGTAILMVTGLLVIEQTGFVASSFFLSLVLCVLISLNEELLVRGYILGNFMASFNKYVALVLSAILFAILHIFNPNTSPVGILNLFLAGILLGASYIYTKNLWFPVALHFSWNFFQGPVFGFHVSGLDMHAIIIQKPPADELFSGGEFGFEGSLLATFLSLLMIGWVIYYFRGE